LQCTRKTCAGGLPGLGHIAAEIIVHGHSPVPAAKVLANRIKVDAGSFAIGRSIGVVLEANGHRFIKT
jgi:hypothetical protein